MIAEGPGLDWTVVGVLTPIVLAAATFAAMWGRKSGESAGLQQAIGFQRELIELKLAHIGDDLVEVRRAQSKAEKAAQEHRHDDNDRFHEIALWKEWIEGVLASAGLITNIRDTGPHRKVERRVTPSSEDSR